ncbi:MAG TPA: M28 family peptidase, partial [Blastocatellia bacterium]|nr:M28 family peptidase [Blastocatellia bacterium]
MNRYNPFKRWLAAQVLAAFVAAATVFAGTLPLPPARATESITATELKMHLGFLASDELGGRYTFSPSLKLAARYLASRLESYGYRGAARDGSFFQVVPLGYRNVNRSASEVVLNVAGTSKSFKYSDAFLSMSPSDINVEGEMVFAGHGISSPRNNHDDYAGLDVKGKIVVAMEGLPSSVNAAALLENEVGEEAALARGAVGMIRIAPSHYLSNWQDVTEWVTREQLGLVPRPAAGKSIPTIVAGPPLIEALAGLLKIESSQLVNEPGESRARPKPAPIQATARIKMSGSVKLAPPTQNVVAVLEGSDPALKNEYLVLSAHYDHLETKSNGEVYNGADDDGSGTSAVLEIAQAFSMEPRSKRSILVVFHTAEELG